MFRNSYDTGATEHHTGTLCSPQCAGTNLGQPTPSSSSRSRRLTRRRGADVTTWSPQGRIHQIECAGGEASEREGVR